MSITENRVDQEVNEKGDRVQLETYHINKSPEGPLKESYESLTGQNLQQIGHGITEDSSVYTKKRERDMMHINTGNEIEKAAFAFYSLMQRG